MVKNLNFKAILRYFFKHPITLIHAVIFSKPTKEIILRNNV